MFFVCPPLKMNGALIQCKDGWDWDRLPDGDGQSEDHNGSKLNIHTSPFVSISGKCGRELV